MDDIEKYLNNHLSSQIKEIEDNIKALNQKIDRNFDKSTEQNNQINQRLDKMAEQNNQIFKDIMLLLKIKRIIDA